MLWQPMTIDEYAASQQADGMKVVKIDKIWWVEVRPFFFRPLFPFAEVDPFSQRYPARSLFGGVLHVVAPSGAPANAKMHFFVYDHLQDYSLDVLSNKRRKIAAQGLQNFTFRKFDDPAEFVASGYEVYREFYNRTKYWYRRERIQEHEFARWANWLFADGKIVKVGAYHRDKLCAIETSYRVEDIIFGDTLFSNELGKRLNVTDFILHRLREEAAATDARYLYLGLPSGVQSLDESKVIRGCKVLSRPARLRMNPLALSVAKLLMKPSYQKLLTVTLPDLPQLCYAKDSIISEEPVGDPASPLPQPARPPG